MSRKHCGSAVLLAWLITSSMSPVARADEPTSIGTFLKVSLQAGSKSLMRTDSFFGVKRLRKNLQLAFVIDGTDSMQEQFKTLADELKVIVADLSSRKADSSGTISFAVVVYRDTGSGKDVEIPTPVFISDVGEFEKVLRAVETKSGAPYFEERVDAGVGAAIAQLNWSTAKDTTKWLMVIGDAPPYPEAAGPAFRSYSAAQLVENASKKDIHVFGFLTKAGSNSPTIHDYEKLEKSWQSSKSASITFLDKLTGPTGGSTVNLADKEKIKAILDPNKPIVQKIPEITAEEVADARQSEPAPVRPIRVGFLPHSDFASMSFDPGNAGQQFATFATQKWSHLPGIEPVKATEIEAAWARLQSPLDDKSARISELANALSVDYLVWGLVTDTDGFSEIRSTVFSTGLDQHVSSATLSCLNSNLAELNRLSGAALLALREQTIAALGETQRGEDLLVALQSPERDPVIAARVKSQIAETKPAQDAILSGIGNVRIALEFEKRLAERADDGDSEAVRLLTAAKHDFEAALVDEPNNALAHLLLANCHFNLAPYVETSDGIKKFHWHLREAYENRGVSSSVTDLIQLEIEAEYALMAVFNYQDAVTALTRLASSGNTAAAGDFSLRAEWLLAGLRLGDWGVREKEPQFLDVSAARGHIVRILAQYPDSGAANFYRKLKSPESSSPGQPRMLSYPLAQARFPGR